MLDPKKAFSSFSVNDIPKAKEFCDEARIQRVDLRNTGYPVTLGPW
jgi:hypothetical protein